MGIEGNEKVDSLAKAATTLNECIIKQIPYSDFFQYIKEQATEKNY